jgi:hypothetical protein
MKTFAPGIYFDIPEADYFAAEGVSQSLLKEMYCSAAHAHAYLTEPRPPATEAQIIGKLGHQAILEPKRLSSWAVKPRGMSFATTEGKTWKAANASRQIVPFDDDNNIKRAVRSVHAHPAAGPLLRVKARKEVSVFARDEETGLLLKGRFDFLPEDNAFILDLKSTLDASPKYPGFMREIAKYRHFVQAAFYTDLAARLGISIPSFLLVAYEKYAPFAVTCFQLDDLSIKKGREEYRRLLSEFADCLKANRWNAYSDKVVICTIPEWALKDQPFESAFAYELHA